MYVLQRTSSSNMHPPDPTISGPTTSIKFTPQYTRFTTSEYVVIRKNLQYISKKILSLLTLSSESNENVQIDH